MQRWDAWRQTAGSCKLVVVAIVVMVTRAAWRSIAYIARKLAIAQKWHTSTATARGLAHACEIAKGTRPASIAWPGFALG